MVAGGLRSAGIERVVLSSSAPSAADVARGFCLGTPLRFALEQRGSLDALTDRMAAEMTERLGPGPVEGELAALLVHATRPGAS